MHTFVFIYFFHTELYDNIPCLYLACFVLYISAVIRLFFYLCLIHHLLSWHSWMSPYPVVYILVWNLNPLYFIFYDEINKHSFSFVYCIYTVTSK